MSGLEQYHRITGSITLQMSAESELQPGMLSETIVFQDHFEWSLGLFPKWKSDIPLTVSASWGINGSRGEASFLSVFRFQITSTAKTSSLPE